MKFLLILLLLIPVITTLDKYKSEKSYEEAKGELELKKAQALKDLVKGNTEFAINFFKHLTSRSSQGKNPSPKNVVFSPFSISTAFSMLLLGARTKTNKEIWKGLSLNNTNCKEKEVHQAFSNLLQILNEPKSSLQVNVGNAIFFSNKLSLLKSFRNNTQHYYQAEIMEEDFCSEKEVENKEKINGYVKKRTEGKIEELIQEIPADTKMILINYVLFKGEWQNKFLPARAALFYLDKNTEVYVPMMHRTGPYNTFQDTDLPCTVVELPYKDNASMIIAMAELGKIREVEQGLSAETIQRWRTSFNKMIIEVSLPKFSISSTLDLREDLFALGLRTAFTKDADFHGITQDGDLNVGKAVHQAVLDVDEQGTVAAASTAIVMVRKMSVDLKINRPFICIVCEHNTNSILFMATVMNPAKN